MPSERKPLVAAYTRSGSFVASDLTALILHETVFCRPEDHIVRLTSYKVHLNLQRHEEMPD